MSEGRGFVNLDERTIEVLDSYARLSLEQLDRIRNSRKVSVGLVLALNGVFSALILSLSIQLDVPIVARFLGIGVSLPFIVSSVWLLRSLRGKALAIIPLISDFMKSTLTKPSEQVIIKIIKYAEIQDREWREDYSSKNKLVNNALASTIVGVIAVPISVGILLTLSILP